MDIILAIISSITGILVAVITSRQSKDSPKIEDISTKLFKFKESTNDKLDIMGKDFKDVRNEVEGLSRSMSTLKKEIQDIHISHAKIDLKEIKETYGKVIVLDERSRAFEQMHMRTANEIANLKKVKPMDGD